MKNRSRLLIFILLVTISVYTVPTVLMSQPSPTNNSQKQARQSAKRKAAKNKTTQSKEAEWSPLTECQSEQTAATDTPTYRVGANSTGVAAASTRVYKDGLIIPDDEDLHSPEVMGIRFEKLQARQRKIQWIEERLQLIAAGGVNEKWLSKLRPRYDQVRELQNSASWAKLPKFDWREKGLDVGPVMNQGKCGSCWAFAAASVYLSSWKLEKLRSGYDLRNELMGNLDYWYERLPSVQQLLNCISKSKGDCTSGWHGTAFDFMVTSHVPHTPDRLVWNKPDKASIEEYTARKSPCTNLFRNSKVKRGEGPAVGLKGPDSNFRLPANSDQIQTAFDRALAWGYVNDKDPNQMPSPDQLKAALVEHGPLAVSLNADNCFTVYKGGVFNGHNKYSPNHVVMLIGWDDSKRAWLIKNSWGVAWGEQGFGWIEYGSNSIGRFAAWIEPQLGR